MTITEALAEIKLIDNKISSQRKGMEQYLVRQERFKDPMHESGGSRKYVRETQQSIEDLFERKVIIRRAIQNENTKTTLQVNSQTRTVSDWLVWRREVAPTQQNVYREWREKIQTVRKEASRNDATVHVGDTPTNVKPNDIYVNLDEKAVVSRETEIGEILSVLDGKLSLTNATTYVDV